MSPGEHNRSPKSVCSSVSSIAPWEIEVQKKAQSKLMFSNMQNAKTRPWSIPADCKDSTMVVQDMVNKGLSGKQIMDHLTKLYPATNSSMKRSSRRILNDTWPDGTIKQTHPNGFALVKRPNGREDVVTPAGIKVEVRLVEAVPPPASGPERAAGMTVKQRLEKSTGRKSQDVISQIPREEFAGISLTHIQERIASSGKKNFESPLGTCSLLSPLPARTPRGTHALLLLASASHAEPIIAGHRQSAGQLYVVYALPPKWWSHINDDLIHCRFVFAHAR